MTELFPSYYPSFSCIGGACKHNCCIGWEIDVDEEALCRYEAVEGAFGARLRENISKDGTPHFLLGECGRCRFLNDRNLCDVILNLGEEALCEICAEHPRFRNFLPGRVEVGLGLCCEEAARLILSQRAPFSLISAGEIPEGDEIIDLRDRAILLLQDRSLPLFRRLEAVDRLCENRRPPRSVEEICDLLLSLERLDEGWTELLLRTRNVFSAADPLAFSAYLQDRVLEFEQFAVYLVYRHMANAWDAESLAARADFVHTGTRLLYAMASVIFAQTGSFSFSDLVELARRFSSELEYSEENMARVLGEEG